MIQKKSLFKVKTDLFWLSKSSSSNVKRIPPLELAIYPFLNLGIIESRKLNYLYIKLHASC